MHFKYLILLQFVIEINTTGSRVNGGVVMRALASHQCDPAGSSSIPGPGVLWAEFVVGSHPCSEGFSPGSLVFLPSQEPTLLNSKNLIRE